MTIKKDIIYPMFIECLPFCETKFWNQIFEDLAYGKCPYGTYIHKNFFCCNYKSKEFSYKIEENNSEELYQNIFTLLTKKLGMLSDEEKKNKLLDFYTLENSFNDFKYDKWSSIKKKNIKDSLIENFIVYKKREYNLTDIQARKLHQNINLGLIFKTISNKDIILKNGEIDSIQGINFTNKNFIIEKDLIKSDDNEITSENFQVKPKLSELINKLYFPDDN